jgi:hypothetical protein
VLSRHEISIAAPPERVWEALLEQELGASPLTKTFLFLRGYGGRALHVGAGTLPERLERFGFTRLDQVPGRELVFGIAGRFWRWNGDLRAILDRAGFESFAEDGCVKAAWNLAIGSTDGVSCDLSTETRIQYFGAAARRRFRRYWSLIAPFSGAIRVALLRGVERRAERFSN